MFNDEKYLIYSEQLKAVQDYLMNFCSENVVSKILMPKKVLVRKPNRRIVTNGMSINEIMRLNEYGIKASFLLHNFEASEKEKIKDYILQLFNYDDEFLAENKLLIEAKLPYVYSSELKKYIMEYIDLRVKLFEYSLKSNRQKVLSKQKPEV